ncbi:MAG TPA: FGGY family carbohydrate kinase [Bacillota bacterium]|nr:FGGY family carbohydrate kinase [Bacillota bacterium]
MVKNMKVIGLEVSTSSAKAIVFGANEGVVAEVTLPFPEDVASGPTQDADGIVATAICALKEVVNCAGCDVNSIGAIGLSGTWHSLLLLDKEFKPLGRIRTWADLSAAPTVAPLRRDNAFLKKFYHNTGCMAHAIYPVWKWIHLVRTLPDLARKTVYLSSQLEYVYQALTRERSVSRCAASGTGLMNINSLDWDDEILEFAGIKREQLGELVEAFHTAPLLPSVAKEVGLPQGLPVTVGCADGAMNQVGIGGVREGIMSMSVGTSGALRVVHKVPKLPDKPSTWCYYLFNGRRLAGAAINGATNCVDWYLDCLGAKDKGQRDYERFTEGASGVSAEKAPYFLPFLFGERCPGWHEEKTGGFYGVKGSHNEFDLYYSILEGVLFNMYQCYKILAEIGGTPGRILMSGGILNSPLWSQMAADIFEREILATGVANDSTVGAALIALESCGGIDSVEDYQPLQTMKFTPRDDKLEIYESRFRKYLDLYAELK